MAIANFTLIIFHHLWLTTVTISCIGFTIDIFTLTTPARSASIPLLLIFTPIWLSLDLYLYGSLCTLLHHTPRRPLLARLVALHERVFARACTAAASLICLVIVWISGLSAVLIEFWVFLFFQMPSWWNRWIMRGVSAYVIVPYVSFMCLLMTLGWVSLVGWLCVRAVKAFWSVRCTLDDMVREEERERLTRYAGDADFCGVGADKDVRVTVAVP